MTLSENSAKRKALDHLTSLAEAPDHIGFNADGDPTQIQLCQRCATDQDLASFRLLPTFEWISLGECPVTDIGLEHLSGLHRLRFLDLQETQITDAGLHHLARLKALSELNLLCCQITGKGLQSLKGLTNLRKLTLYEEDFSDEEMANIIAAIPGLKIVDSMGSEIM